MENPGLQRLREETHLLNKRLFEEGLALFTWGNASIADRKQGLIAIKPSGIPYEEMNPEDIVIMNMEGKIVSGTLKPSSDSVTHIMIYRSFSTINCIIHTHSHWATVWAQAGKGIPVLGTTHADHFYGTIPCTRKLKAEEIEQAYEKNTGKVIVETFVNRDPEQMPAVLVNNHGPFCWGIHARDAFYHAVVLEEIARMAYHTLQIAKVPSIDQALLDKHFFRKHGDQAYYGQSRPSGKE